jgi:hypothetical protein
MSAYIKQTEDFKSSYATSQAPRKTRTNKSLNKQKEENHKNRG